MVTYILGGLLFSILGNINSNLLGIIIGMTICTYILINIWRIFKKKINQNNCKCDICININGEYISASTLIDTGHSLKDNVLDCDVILLNKKILLNIIPNEIMDIMSKKELSIPEEYETKIRILTFKTVESESNILVGFKIDNVKIYYDGKTIENNKAIIALPNCEIKNYDAIINFSLIDRGIVCGDTSLNKIKNKKIIHKVYN
jgi:stage II sporulation protein GA (sporulation sigma-E factor processing peptidase)